MRVFGNRVLIEQTETKKATQIIQLDKNKKNDYDVTFKVLQIGSGCPIGPDELKVGDIPILSRNVTYEGIKVIEEKKNSISKEVEKMVIQTIIYYEDIVGAE